ncbi:MAG: hypothetical protein ACI4AK_06975 [Lepagella sp.]
MLFIYYRHPLYANTTDVALRKCSAPSHVCRSCKNIVGIFIVRYCNPGIAVVGLQLAEFFAEQSDFVDDRSAHSRGIQERLNGVLIHHQPLTAHFVRHHLMLRRLHILVSVCLPFGRRAIGSSFPSGRGD